jgi:hypothetical protein
MPCRFESPAIAELQPDRTPLVLINRYLRDADLDAVLNELHRIEKGPSASPQRILVPLRLIVRESCGARQAGVAMPEVSA